MLRCEGKKLIADCSDGKTHYLREYSSADEAYLVKNILLNYIQGNIGNYKALSKEFGLEIQEGNIFTLPKSVDTTKRYAEIIIDNTEAKKINELLINPTEYIHEISSFDQIGGILGE